MIASANRKKEVRSLQLGDESNKPEAFLRIVLLSPGGIDQPATWTMKVLPTREKLPVVLDGESTAQLDYAVNPDAASSIAAGDYRVRAILEVPPSANLPASAWRGRAESEPVTIKILEAALTPSDKEKMELDFAEYFYATGDFAASQERALKVTAANPKSIAAWTIVGDTREHQNDLKGALAAYLTAAGEFNQQYPNSYESPQYLVRKTNQLIEKLNGKK